MVAECPACHDGEQQESVGQLWDRPLTVYHCMACDHLYLASSNGTPSLADAERRLLSLTAAGMSVKRIAETLDVCPRTVNMRRTRLRDKFGVDSNAELVRLAVERGLL